MLEDCVPTLVFMALIYFTNQQYDKISRSYFHKVDKIVSGSSYKTLKLWEIHDFIFKSCDIHEIFVL